jgi:hypothetical protein
MRLKDGRHSIETPQCGKCSLKRQLRFRLILESVKEVIVGAGLPRDSVGLHKVEKNHRGPRSAGPLLH